METKERRMDVAVRALGLNPNEQRTCGTTLVAMECADGVIMGVDSRTSVGSYVASRVTDKITPVTDTVCVLRAGSAADTQAITDIVKYRIELHEMFENEKVTVYRAAQIFRQYLYEYRDDLSGSVLVVGYDDVEGPQVYAIPMGGFVTRQRCAASGSGSLYIQGYIDSQWRPEITLADAESIVKTGVTLATIRDGGSGGVVRLGMITKDGLERKVFREDKGSMPTFTAPASYPTFSQH